MTDGGPSASMHYNRQNQSLIKIFAEKRGLFRGKLVYEGKDPSSPGERYSYNGAKLIVRTHHIIIEGSTELRRATKGDLEKVFGIKL
jgi:hypothetical protein